jgi:hypothetical protein
MFMAAMVSVCLFFHLLAVTFRGGTVIMFMSVGRVMIVIAVFVMFGMAVMIMTAAGLNVC